MTWDSNLDQYRGQEIKFMGDGLLATFDGPARAIYCASAITQAVRPLGIEIRAGLHTGEIKLAGRDIGGVAVHIGARVAGEAGPGEIVVSSTVKDLVAGSGIRFADRGTHVLKGIPGEWRLFAAEMAWRESRLPGPAVPRQYALADGQQACDREYGCRFGERGARHRRSTASCVPRPVCIPD